MIHNPFSDPWHWCMSIRVIKCALSTTISIYWYLYHRSKCKWCLHHRSYWNTSQSSSLCDWSFTSWHLCLNNEPSFKVIQSFSSWYKIGINWACWTFLYMLQSMIGCWLLVLCNAAVAKHLHLLCFSTHFPFNFSPFCIILLSWSDGIIWSNLNNLIILNAFCFLCQYNCSPADCGLYCTHLKKILMLLLHWWGL